MKGFCCEECIKEFYHHLIEHFSSQEELFRKEASLLEEDYDDLLDDANFAEQVLTKPDQVKVYSNELGEEITQHLAEISYNGKTLYFCVHGFTYQGEISFIIHSQLVSPQSWQEYFWQGSSDVAPEPSETIELDESTIKELELKKESARLLMENRSEDDVDFEVFHEFQSFMQPTFDSPDEVYSPCGYER